MRMTLQLARACHWDSCFSTVSWSRNQPIPMTSHATQVLINSFRFSTSLLLASCLKWLGCSAELPAGAKHNPGLRTEQWPSPSLTAHLYVMNVITWTCQLLGFPVTEVIRALQTLDIGVGLYLFSQLFWHLEEGISLGQGGCMPSRKEWSAEMLLCTLQGWILTLSFLEGSAPAVTPLQSLFPLSPDKGLLAVYSSVFETFLAKTHSTDCPGMIKMECV